MSTSILHKLISLKLGFLTCKDGAQVRSFSDKKGWNRHSSLLKRNSGGLLETSRGQAPRSEVKPPDRKGPGNQGWKNETAFQESRGMCPGHPASAAQPVCRGMATSHGPAVHEQDLSWGAFASQLPALGSGLEPADPLEQILSCWVQRQMVDWLTCRWGLLLIHRSEGTGPWGVQAGGAPGPGSEAPSRVRRCRAFTFPWGFLQTYLPSLLPSLSLLSSLFPSLAPSLLLRLPPHQMGKPFNLPGTPLACVGIEGPPSISPLNMSLMWPQGCPAPDTSQFLKPFALARRGQDTPHPQFLGSLGLWVP